MKRLIVGIVVAGGLALGGTFPAFAGQPASVPPDGSDCGAFFGSVVAAKAQAGVLGPDFSPGTAHQGFAGAQAFGLPCP
jgi:hypothetical protein